MLDTVPSTLLDAVASDFQSYSLNSLEYLTIDGFRVCFGSFADETPFMEIGLFSEEVAENGVAASLASLVLPCSTCSRMTKIGSKVGVDGLVRVFESIQSVQSVLHLHEVHANCWDPSPS